MTNRYTTRQMFSAAVKRREERLDLSLAALLVAQEEYPRIFLEDYFVRLDNLAMDLQVEVDLEADAESVLRGMAGFFALQEFAPNAEDYYDPRNSYLNEVLDRRLGIPISLSIVWMEVGRRAGIKLAPVSFPGHFLIKLSSGEGEIFVDPFNAGRQLSPEDCKALLKHQFGDSVHFRDTMLSAATKRQVILRLLQNLKAIYLRQEDLERALRIEELITTVTPWDLEQVRDRGLLYYRLGDGDRAAQDLRAYAQHAPPGADLEVVYEALRRLE